jgi:hypothetical protein
MTPSPPLEGKLTNNDLLAIRETLLSLLMVILYDQLLGVHSLTAILAEAAKYKSSHGGAKFVSLPASPSTRRTLPMTPRLLSVFALRLPTNPTSKAMPATKKPNVVSPSPSLTSLTGFGTTI